MSYLTNLLKALLNIKDKPGMERASPKIRITIEQARELINVINTVPGYENCFLAGVGRTNSMEPGLDDGMYMVLDPLPASKTIVGDNIWYKHPDWHGGPGEDGVIHRIVEIGTDVAGWYCRACGDNNTAIIDPVIIRAEHVTGVWRMTLN